mgnify:CR=1 FL=1
MKILSLLTCGLAVLSLPTGSEGSVAAGAASALKSIDYRFFIAGGTCAAFSHGITCPIDVIKVTTLHVAKHHIHCVLLCSSVFHPS